jgi:hypothetical protein
MLFIHAAFLFDTNPASRKIVSVGIFAFLLGTMHFASTVAYDQIQMEQILLVDPERDLGERLLDIDLKLMKADLCLQWSAMLAVSTNSTRLSVSHLFPFVCSHLSVTPL